MGHDMDTTSLLSLDTARANGLKTDWDNLEIFVPWFLGRRIVEPRLADLIPFIDWTRFFAATGVPGRFPAVLDDERHGARARELHDHARQMLDRIVREKGLTPRGVYGFWPANSIGDDIVVYKDDARASTLVRFHMLRQQEPAADGRPTLSLADFVAPKDSFAPDYIGAFAVTAGIGLDDLVRDYEADRDEASAAVASAMADRLADAFAESLHAQARKDWGYAEHEQLSADNLIEGQYRGIRPAFGHPACPDRSQNEALFRLLHASDVGITLTESFEMAPAASVSGIYFAHPESAYFGIGAIGRDQIEDYAERQGV